jgi:sulfur carrier protein ThiS
VRIVFKLFATLQDFLPAEAQRTSTMTIELAEDTKIIDVIERFSIPRAMCHLVLVDGFYIPPAQWDSRVLRDGETLAIWPPVAGG